MAASAMTGGSLAPVALHTDRDVTVARRRTKTVGAVAGLDDAAAARLAAAVSELARLAVRDAGGGWLRFGVRAARPSRLLVTVDARGIVPGLDELPVAGDTTDAITRARRLVGNVSITHPDDGGTALGVVVPVTSAAAAALAGRLSADAATPVAAGEETGARVDGPVGPAPSDAAGDEATLLREELGRVQRELEETNRGVVAVYAELEDTADQLRRASELKSRFLSNVSHEFRTPLGSIIALSGLLLDGRLDAEQARQVAYIAQAARDLTTLVDDLLDLSRVEAGRIPVQQVPFDLGELLDHLRDTMAPLVDPERSVALRFAEPPPLPPIVNDPLRVGQIIRNFVSNALKFTEHGEVTVSVRLADAAALPPDARIPAREGTDERSFVVVAVADTGVGIARDDLERIFEEFVQVEGPLQARLKGTGLGLPLARRLATLLGGGVWVQSEPGRGSTFSLALPLEPAPDAGDARPAATRRAGQGRRIATDPIVVADDDEATRYAVADALRGLGHPVKPVGGGIAALAALRGVGAAALVLDLEMPDLHGDELLARLHGDPELARVPVVIHTGRDLSADAAATLLAHARAIVGKGDRDGLGRLVEAVRAAVEGTDA